MLNDYQIMVACRAVAAAKDKDAEIKRIAKGMQVKESEIRLVLDQTPRVESAVSAVQKPEKKSSGRHAWTTGQVEQLLRPCGDGKGPTEIAKIMGLTATQVNSRLKLEKKQQAAESSAPADDDPPGTPPPESVDEPEPQAEEVSEPESTPAILPDEARSLGELARKIFSSDSEETAKSDMDSEPFPFPELEEKRPFILASEIMDLIKYLEYSYPPVKMGLPQANQAAGWATCRFTAAGEQYMISLRREEQKS